MADRLVELLTGQVSADAVSVQAQVMVSDEALVGVNEDPGWVRGYGPIPAEIARALITRASAQGLATLRRFYASAKTGQIVAADSRSTRFPTGLAEVIAARDQDRCRSLWCDAPIRPTDHAKALAEGGETSQVNGQGLCEAHNIAKEAPGWAARPRPGPHGQHIIETTTPTGHTYTSIAPRVRIVRTPITMEIYLPDYQAS